MVSRQAEKAKEGEIMLGRVIEEKCTNFGTIELCPCLIKALILGQCFMCALHTHTNYYLCIGVDSVAWPIAREKRGLSLVYAHTYSFVF